MPTIKAPYNFVPLNTDVVSPHWIDSISHDIPFSDGQSGVIEFKLTAQTEIFVRDGIGQKKAQDNYENGVQQEPYQFSNYQNKYFIPGSSIKGMVRNVLEILTFGKMENRVNNHRYAVRDFSNDHLYPKSDISASVYCGWLRKDGDIFFLSDCGRPYRISHEELSDSLEIDIADFFSAKNNLGNKSAKIKYDRYLGQTFNANHFKIDTNKSNFCSIDPNGSLKGQIVFTGQSSARDKKTKRGKHLEFVFPNPEKWVIMLDEIIKNFFFAYYDHDKNKQSIDWKYWKSKLDQGINIPVFFRKDGEKIKDIGLSMLYKIVYKKSVIESIKYHQQTKYPDFSDAIFGYINNDKPLKGRVHIGHAFAEYAERADEKKEVLSSPKASYYPTYIRQKVDSNSVLIKNKNSKYESYKTFMDENAQIAGWKRYPVHHHEVKNNNGTGDRIYTKFIPLNSGAEFIEKIHFHNLRKVELGALLSALTFHGTADTYHSIGMAKPLGYGKVKLEITKFETIESGSPSVSEYLCAFESYMNAQLDKTNQPWHKQEQVVELVTMAQDAENANFSYMNLDEHIKAKKNKEGLAKYSIIVNKKTSIKSHCNESEIQKMKDLIIEEEKAMQHTENIESVVIACRESARKNILEKLELKKISLLGALEQKRRQIEEKEEEARAKEEAALRAIKKEGEAEIAMKNGPDLNIQTKGKESWNNLKNKIEVWGKKAYKLNSIDDIVKNNPDGFLPQQFHNQLLEILQQIFNELNTHNKKLWMNDSKNNAYRNKVAHWVGAELANEFFTNL